MADYPDHVTRASRRAAERRYAVLSHLYVPPDYDLDELVEVSDAGAFIPAATPERRDYDD